MRPPAHRSLIAAVAAAAALGVAGCGDDEETDTAAQQTAEDTATEQTDTGAAGGDASSVQVGAVEFAFEPSDPAIEEDGQVSIELTNDGEFPHALTIEETEDSTDEIEGGQSDTLETNLDSGEYTIYCPVGDHRAQGMEGTLTVGGSSGSDDSSSDDSSSDDSSSDDSSSDDSASAGSGAGY